MGNVSSHSFNSFDEVTCSSAPGAASTCSSGPTAITAGESTVYGPSSEPPANVTWSEYDTAGNLDLEDRRCLRHRRHNPIASAHYDRAPAQPIAEQPYVSSTTNPPSGQASLPCATVDPRNAVVTQLGYDSNGNLTSTSTPDGNSGGETAETTYTYNADNEMRDRHRLTETSPAPVTLAHTQPRTLQRRRAAATVTQGDGGGTSPPARPSSATTATGTRPR